MDILAYIGIIVLIYNLCKEKFEKPLPKEYHNNRELESQDAEKVRTGQMSRREFIRNMKNGKYK